MQNLNLENNNEQLTLFVEQETQNKGRIKPTLNSRKKRMIPTSTIFLALVGLVSGGVYAANFISSKLSPKLLVEQNSDGSFRYSQDNEKTWESGLSSDAKMTKNPDGSESFSIQDPSFSDSDMQNSPGFMIKTGPDGKDQYSTDGGKTWSSEHQVVFKL
ncbi:hypothetical protein QNH20_11670 [Neobacillus sp. WH10]|uniref:hypothetical protein n=1 Tax=Neobacillus sp. WH10 TaxID=3047873 RepID=UPI0024C10D95|nr:hypothetical protein [Neobacillus sp. WH10]WHY79759.1 hypothetical protein QNH20_11670 [Neobacillus sp. WH10]